MANRRAWGYAFSTAFPTPPTPQANAEYLDGQNPAALGPRLSPAPSFENLLHKVLEPAPYSPAHPTKLSDRYPPTAPAIPEASDALNLAPILTSPSESPPIADPDHRATPNTQTSPPVHKG